ncbi:MAG: HAMP domain-containing protein [Candidatus Nealsonbacteria bacterium]|nr:HAMP domain-containing protein [Candidatus Nealsonbacteria bacterium]
MRRFKDLSINTKLSLLVTVAAGVAMLSACGTFAVNDYRMMRNSKVRQLDALAKVLGANSTAALTYNDPATAAELLSSLSEQPTIRLACFYDRFGELFAIYETDDNPHDTPPAPGPDGHKFTDHGDLEVTYSIVQDGEKKGTLSLHASTADLQKQMVAYVQIVAVVMVVSLAGAVLFCSRMQRAISLPILRLGETAQRISAAGDYSIRVEKEADDELGTLYDEFNRMLDRIKQGEAALQKAHDDLELRVEQRTAQLSTANLDLSREVVERKRTERELEEAHERLVDVARQAGMAEIATGVLHNVGNVLNSINVSATLMADRLRNSRLSDLQRAIEMIDFQRVDLGHFFTTDEKGKLLPEFLVMLAEHLNQERGAIVEELRSLAKNIDHVKTIVSMQQSYAGVAGLVDEVSMEELVEDALKMNQSSFEKHGIEVILHCSDLPETRVERQKLLQVLVNLIANARDSLIESPGHERRLTIRIGPGRQDRMRIEVADNGVGIPPENLTAIFSHGFTTKQHGHGFGLHTSANAVKEMGGHLAVVSEGPGHGATFSVELPLHSVEMVV